MESVYDSEIGVVLGPSRRGAFLDLPCLCSSSPPSPSPAPANSCSGFEMYIANMFQVVCWLHSRGHNFCLQKSRMSLGRIGIFGENILAVTILSFHRNLCGTRFLSSLILLPGPTVIPDLTCDQPAK